MRASKLQKSSGTTPTEKYLVSLCERAFLRLWSYPNLYRDQSGGKELCDVLIVFDRDIIIFSDKSCAYPDTGDEVRDWTRWFSKSISASARQVYGAERWIRHHPDRIFLAPACATPLPLKLPPAERMQIHRVVVARGAGERCSAFFGGDSGSLLVRDDLIGDSHINPAAGRHGIFRIGQLDPEKGCVHVFDDENLDILLSELDTIADFVAYLTRKEAFMCSERVVLATGEEDLLAYYLTHTNADNEHDFAVPPVVDLVNFDHLYQEMRNDEQYTAKKSADQVSYLIDNLIELLAISTSGETLIEATPLSFTDREKALRTLAAESRFSRRQLAKALADLLSSSSANGRPRIKCVLTEDKTVTGYCFLVYHCPRGKDYDKHRQWRVALLANYCTVMKVRTPDLQHIVGYATEPFDGEQRSGDFVYLDVTNWSDDDFREARRIQPETGILASPSVTRVHDSEYPTSLDD